MDTDNLLKDTADRMFGDLCDKNLLDAAERGDFPSGVWSTLREGGFHELGMPDSGVTLADAFTVVRQAGHWALPLPLAEILLANRWLGGSGRLASIGRAADGWVEEVPWGRAVEVVLALDVERPAYALVEVAAAEVEQGCNLAGEPRDRVSLPGGAEWVTLTEPALEYLALARAVAMAGSLERVLALCLQYAGEREQFGRPISKFQAVQHNLAVMAGEVAAASRAADAAVDALDGERFALEVAAGKARVGEAVGVVAELAHQVHGAMGFTYEHQLHHFTRRAWAWRDEYGNEAVWQQRLGRHVAALGADRLWGFLATRG